MNLGHPEVSESEQAARKRMSISQNDTKITLKGLLAAHIRDDFSIKIRR